MGDFIRSMKFISSAIALYPCKSAIRSSIEFGCIFRSGTLNYSVDHYTKKFFIKDFFNKCDQIRSFQCIWWHLLKKSFIENFNFCARIPWINHRAVHRVAGPTLAASPKDLSLKCSRSDFFIAVFFWEDVSLHWLNCFLFFFLIEGPLKCFLRDCS